MTKSLYELGLEYDKEIAIVEEKIKDCKQRIKAIRKGLSTFPGSTEKCYSLEKLIQIYKEELNELRDKAKTLKTYYEKEG